MNDNGHVVAKTPHGYRPDFKRTLTFDDESANDGYESDNRLVIYIKNKGPL